MTRAFSIVMMILLAVTTLVASASADVCPPHRIGLLALEPNGVVTRSIYVQKSGKSQNGAPAPIKFVSVVRDQITLVENDEITLNVSPSMVDAIHTAKISIESQDRDDQGILSTTYRVVESMTSTFAGSTHAKSVDHAYLATVKGNYIGQGKTIRLCGMVTLKELDLNSSSDVRL